MSTRKTFTKALSLIPSTEHIESRSFILHGGNLYFQGDRSRLFVSNFMTMDTNIVISHRLLNTVMNMSGIITASRESEYTTVFSNGKAKLTVGTTECAEAPEMEWPEETEFHELGDVLTNGRNIFSLMDKHSIVSALALGGAGCVAMVSASLVACALGDLQVEMDLTAIEPIIRSAITNKASIFTDRTLLYTRVQDTDAIAIYASTRYSRVNMTEKAKNLITSVNEGDCEGVTDDTGVTLTLRAEDMIEMHGVIEKMNYGGHVTYEISPQRMKVSAMDEYRVLFENPIPVTASGEAVFKSKLISRSMLEFLSAASGLKTPSTYQVVINWERRVMIVRTSEAAEGKGGFVLIGIMPHTVTGAR